MVLNLLLAPGVKPQATEECISEEQAQADCSAKRVVRKGHVT